MPQPNVHTDRERAAAEARAELELRTLERNWGPRRKDLPRQELRQYVLAPFTGAVCLRRAQVPDNARRAGRPISTTDAWVAATALADAVPLVTQRR